MWRCVWLVSLPVTKLHYFLFLCPPRLQPHLEIQPTKSRFAFSVSILDLDPKPYESIPHQYKLDSKIVNYYLKSTNATQELPPSSLYTERQDCTLLFHPVWTSLSSRPCSTLCFSCDPWQKAKPEHGMHHLCVLITAFICSSFHSLRCVPIFFFFGRGECKRVWPLQGWRETQTEREEERERE